MKILCVTGAPGSDLPLVESILAAAGVEFSSSTAPDKSLDIFRWHEQVLASVNESERNSRQQPGRLWEQPASAIFLENIGKRLWGWTDARSTWLLDFWHGFEPQMHFLLVYTAPERALSQALSRDPACDPAVVLRDWQRFHQELLRFRLRHPQRTLLVDAAQCDRAPQQLVDACADHWHLSFSGKLDPSRQSVVPTPLVDYLAHRLYWQEPETVALQNEMIASLHVLDTGAAVDPTLPDAIRDFAATQAQVRSLQLGVEQLTVQQRQHEKLAHQHASLVGEIAKLDTEHAARGKTIAELNDRVRSLNIALSDVRQSVDDKQLEQSRIQGQLDAANQGIKEEQSENQRLLADLQAMRDESERVYLHNQELLAHASLPTPAVQVDDSEMQKENALLLLQLHQVQAELEHYFFEHEKAKLTHRETQARWQRLLLRQPDYCDYHAIEAQVLPAGRSDMDIRWRITQFAAAGRDRPEIRFGTVIEDNVLQFVFELSDSDADACAGLLRWPAPESRQVRLDARGPNLAESDNPIARLATSDMQLLSTLCALLGDALERQAVTLEGADRSGVISALRRYSDDLDALPDLPRFDRLQLKREQANPDYEHLWLVIENLSAGGLRCPHFVFRLACGNVRPTRFGSHPKLEFPAEGGRAPLEKWFDEAVDDFGEKLELRFALPDAMDMGVWQALSHRDHGFLADLIALLPSLLEQLRQQDTSISRAWGDWDDMVLNLQQIYRRCTAPSTPRASAATHARTADGRAVVE